MFTAGGAGAETGTAAAAVDVAVAVAVAAVSELLLLRAGDGAAIGASFQRVFCDLKLDRFEIRREIRREKTANS